MILDLHKKSFLINHLNVQDGSCVLCLLVISNSLNKTEYMAHKKKKSIRIIISIKKLCSFILSWIFRIISQRKASFIVTLQLVIFWLAVITELKCQTLGWWDRSTKTCTVETIRRSFLWNGWPQNHLMTAFIPSRVMCKSIFLCDVKTFTLTLRRTYSLLTGLRWSTGEN